LLMLVFIYLLINWPLWLLLPLAVLIYGLFMILMKGVDKKILTDIIKSK